MFKILAQTFQRPNLIFKQNAAKQFIPLLYRTKSGTSTSNETKPETINPSSVWTKLYHMEYIHHISVLSRVKIFQASFAVFATPVAFGFENFSGSADFQGLTILVGTMGKL